MARILVIDDEHNIRTMVRLALEQVGHEVDVAEDGPSGLGKFGDGSDYDLVLLDQRMPGMEGLEVLREMKVRNPRARIVMITAYGTIDLAVDAMKAGATDFLRKPFTTEVLRGAVLGALAAVPSVVSVPQPEPEAPPAELPPLLYGLTTVNGFHIQSDPDALTTEGDDLGYTFSVRRPDGQVEDCALLLSSRIVSEAKAIARRDRMPGENRFWHALCEHVLSNYLYQNAAIPLGGLLRIDEMDRSLRNWVKAAMRATR